MVVVTLVVIVVVDWVLTLGICITTRDCVDWMTTFDCVDWMTTRD